MTFEHDRLYIDGEAHQLAHPIAAALDLGERVVVLYEPGAYEKKWGQFANLIAVSREGEELWVAELPTTTSGDRYSEIWIANGLWAYSIYSFECEISPEEGKIVQRIFLK